MPPLNLSGIHYISYDKKEIVMKQKKSTALLTALTLTAAPVSGFATPAATTFAAATNQAAQSIGTQKMHRVYNPNSGEHFYTANDREASHLIKLGWKNEGIGWYAPKTSKTPVYRLYNKNAGDHHYTLNVKERNHLIKLGWNDEGIGWYSDDAMTVPLYRQYNPNAKSGAHNFTTNLSENNRLVKLGWKAEGISWYGVTEESVRKLAAAESAVEAAKKVADAAKKAYETAQTAYDQVKSGKKTVVDQEAWDEKVEVTPEVKKTVTVKEAYDEKVVDVPEHEVTLKGIKCLITPEGLHSKETFDKNVAYSATVGDQNPANYYGTTDYDEYKKEVEDWNAKYANKLLAEYVQNEDGSWTMTSDYLTDEELSEDDDAIGTALTNFNNKYNTFATYNDNNCTFKKTVPATYKTVHHDAVTEQKTVPATYKTVHHDAVTHEEKIPVEEIKKLETEVSHAKNAYDTAIENLKAKEAALAKLK